MTVHGHCDPGFEPVRDEFQRNFDERGEVGASVCVLKLGNVVVDLWGGVADRRTGRPWERDTVGVVFSCTKGAVAACALLLAVRGRLDLDQTVAHYWPEFAAHGKGDVRVSWLLSHQSGVPALKEPLAPGTLFDWDAMTAALARAEPWHEPGTRQAYAAGTFGHMVGEVVRRVDGRDLGTFFREEIARPRSIDLHLGLPESEHLRVAPTIKPDPLPPGEPPWRFLTVANADRDSIQAAVIRNTGRKLGDTESPHALSAIVPSSGGVTNARGLAKFYDALPSLLGPLLPRAMTAHSASAIDGALLVGMSFGLGFMLSADNRRGPTGATDSVILSPSAFGHAGMGGSLGFHDAGHGLSFGYTMNKQGRGVLLNPRGQSLVDAVYRCLEGER